jgi:hypothetical protein
MQNCQAIFQLKQENATIKQENATIKYLINHVVESNVQTSLENSVFLLYENGVPIGTCFFVSPKILLTANHNLEIGQSEIECLIDGKQSTLKVLYRDLNYDFAVLLSSIPHQHHLTISKDSVLPGSKAVFVSYNVGINEDLDASFNGSFSVTSAIIVKKSPHHVVYQGFGFAGDSGSALTLIDGKVIAIHLEGINQAKERLRGKNDFDNRLNAVEESVDGLTKNLAQGSIGLLLSSFHTTIADLVNNNI